MRWEAPPTGFAAVLVALSGQIVESCKVALYIRQSRIDGLVALNADGRLRGQAVDVPSLTPQCRAAIPPVRLRKETPANPASFISWQSRA